MTIKYIELKNWKGLSGGWTIGPLTYIHGPNGAGKSAIIQAIQWCLTGEIPGIGKIASAVGALTGPAGGSVSLAIVGDDGQTTTITRALKIGKKSTTTTVMVDLPTGETLEGAVARGVIASMIRPLTWLLDQHSLSSMSPGDRRKALLGLIFRPDHPALADLDIPADEDPARWIERQVRVLETEIRDLGRESKRLDAVLTEATAGLMPEPAALAERDNWAKRLTEARERLHLMEGDRGKLIAERKKTEAKKNRLELTVKKLTDELAGLPSESDLTTALAEAQRPLDQMGTPPEPVEWTAEMKRALAEAEKRMKNAEVRGKQLRQILDHGTICPIDKQPCPRDWTATSTIPQALEDLRSEYSAAWDIVIDLERRRTEAEGVARQIQEWTAKTADLREKIAKTQATLQHRRDVEAHLVDVQSELAEVADHLARLPIPPDGIEPEIETLRVAVDEAQKNMTQYQAVLDAWQKARGYAVTKKNIDMDLTEKRDNLAKLRRIQAEAIESAFAEVADEATALLAPPMPAGAQIVAKLEKSSIRLGVSIGGQYRDLTALSQGQAVTFWLAVATALLRRHTGLKLVVVEVAELSGDMLAQVMDHLAGQSKELADVQILMASWVHPAGADLVGAQSWTVMEIGGAE